MNFKRLFQELTMPNIKHVDNKEIHEAQLGLGNVADPSVKKRHHDR